MTADGLTSYVWNGAGLLKTVGTTTYTYDGDGKRVMNSAGTYYWTTPSGDQLSDTPGAGAGNEYIFFAGQRIAWVDSGGTVRYYWGDHLGTTPNRHRRLGQRLLRRRLLPLPGRAYSLCQHVHSGVQVRGDEIRSGVGELLHAEPVLPSQPRPLAESRPAGAAMSPTPSP